MAIGLQISFQGAVEYLVFDAKSIRQSSMELVFPAEGELASISWTSDDCDSDAEG